MGRIDIELPLVWISNDLDIKPSSKNAIRKALLNQDIWDIKHMCSKSEEELLLIPEIDDTILEAIKECLRGYGLTLGMSADDLLEYQDAEYYEKHPEEKSQVNTIPNKEDSIDAPEEENLIVSEEDDLTAIKQRMKEEYFPIASSLDNNQSKPVPLLDNTLKQKLRTVFERNSRSEVKKRLTDKGLMRIDADDMEWVWVNYFRMFYLGQPLYIRLVKSKKARIAMAKKEADEMRKAHIDSLVSDISKSLTNKFCDSLDKDWNEHWESIMTKLGIK